MRRWGQCSRHKAFTDIKSTYTGKAYCIYIYIAAYVKSMAFDDKVINMSYIWLYDIWKPNYNSPKLSGFDINVISTLVGPH